MARVPRSTALSRVSAFVQVQGLRNDSPVVLDGRIPADRPDRDPDVRGGDKSCGLYTFIEMTRKEDWNMDGIIIFENKF